VTRDPAQPGHPVLDGLGMASMDSQQRGGKRFRGHVTSHISTPDAPAHISQQRPAMPGEENPERLSVPVRGSGQQLLIGDPRQSSHH
jgi:hypothetical protein